MVQINLTNIIRGTEIENVMNFVSALLKKMTEPFLFCRIRVLIMPSARNRKVGVEKSYFSMVQKILPRGVTLLIRQEIFFPEIADERLGRVTVCNKPIRILLHCDRSKIQPFG